jgi:phosphoribosylformylglycinamidine synthase I
MSKIKALVLTGYGLNCDHETAYAFELAGAKPVLCHINDLISGAMSLDGVHIMAFIGGFSWGDDHGAGVVQAVRMRTQMGDKLLRFIDQGKLIIGICNGFQCLVNLGLLPALDDDYTRRSVALTYNDCGNFQDRWVNLSINPASPCIWTRHLTTLELPVRHGEGKFFADDETMSRLAANQQVALQYACPDGSPAKGEFPFNPNGSIMDIAGICDPSGRIFGLMPHPEGYNHWTNHPNWMLLKEQIKRRKQPPVESITPGIALFKNAVDYFEQT